MKIYAILMILMSAAITFALRALPFAIFRGNRQMPTIIQQLGNILPSAIMAVLVIYCIKDVSTSFTQSGLWQIISVVVTAVSYKWKHNTFFSILLGTACYMVLIRLCV